MSVGDGIFVGVFAGGFRRLRTASDFARGGSSSQSPLDSVSAWWRKLRSFPCSSSSRRTHFVGLRREVRERLPKTPPGTAPDEHFVLIVAYPTPFVASRHLPLTGGVGPGPLLRGLPLEPGKNFRRAKSEWLSAISSGPLGPGCSKIAAVAVPHLRLALPNQRSRSGFCCRGGLWPPASLSFGRCRAKRGR